MKLVPARAFQLFYWEHVAGVVPCSLCWPLTLDNWGSGKPSVSSNMNEADTRGVLLTIVGGFVSKVGNLFVVAAIEIAGLAVVFRVAIGLVPLVGVALNYAVLPNGRPLLLFGGMVRVTLAVVRDAIACFLREGEGWFAGALGVWISSVCGVPIGVFCPVVANALEGLESLGSRTVILLLAAGRGVCVTPVNYLPMKRPVTRTSPVRISEYFDPETSWRLWGAVGGNHLMQGIGLQHRRVAFGDRRSRRPLCNQARWHDAVGLVGVLIWKELVKAPPASQKPIPAIAAIFRLLLGSIALDPLVTR